MIPVFHAALCSQDATEIDTFNPDLRQAIFGKP